MRRDIRKPYDQHADIMRRIDDAEIHGNTNLLAILKMALNSHEDEHRRKQASLAALLAQERITDLEESLRAKTIQYEEERKAKLEYRIRALTCENGGVGTPWA